MEVRTGEVGTEGAAGSMFGGLTSPGDEDLGHNLLLRQPHHLQSGASWSRGRASRRERSRAESRRTLPARSDSSSTADSCPAQLRRAGMAAHAPLSFNRESLPFFPRSLANCLVCTRGRPWHR